MPEITIPYAMYVGIDVGSKELMTFIRFVEASKAVNVKDEAQRLSKAKRSDKTLMGAVPYEQTKKAYGKLRSALLRAAKQHSISTDDILITMEATGNYWMPIASFLYRSDFNIMVVNPATARRYAGMQLKRSKSDPIDAMVLASLGLVMAVDKNMEIRLWHEPPAIYDELQQSVKLHQDISKHLTQNKNRKKARSWRTEKVDNVIEREDEIIQFLDKHKKDVENEIRSLLRSQSEWRRNAKILMSIPGFGVIVSSYLLVVTQNFTLFDTYKQLQSYAGLVPREFSSGKLQKRKHIGHAGNETLRKLLFMAASTAAYRDKRLRKYKVKKTKEDPDEKRKEKVIRPNKGKASTAVHVAVAAKLIRIAWACIHNDTLYDPKRNLDDKPQDTL